MRDHQMIKLFFSTTRADKDTMEIPSKCQGKITEPGFYIQSNHHSVKEQKKDFPDL
jgi:hypothetical protein